MSSFAPRFALRFALLLSSFVAHSVGAQTVSTVRGTVTNEAARPLEKMPLDKALQVAPEVGKKALFMPSNLCLFVDGVARPGMNLGDFAPEDVESVELYGSPGRVTMTFQRGGPINGKPDTARSVRQSDPSGTLMSRWPPKMPCGREPTLAESRVDDAVVKVIFAVVWTKQP